MRPFAGLGLTRRRADGTVGRRRCGSGAGSGDGAELPGDELLLADVEPFADGLLAGGDRDDPLEDLVPHLLERRGAVDDATADISGGHLAGALSFRSAEDGLKAHGKISLTGVDAASLLPSAARPQVTGSLALSAEVEGSGLSPVALIGSLRGAGQVALSDGQLAGLDPRAFDAVTRAVDQGLPIHATRISDAVDKALDSGQLAVKNADGTLAMSAGQVRLSNATVGSGDAALSLAGILDLTDGSLDARLILSGSGQAGGARPDIFMALKGPLSSPARSIDVSALTGWLTLRAVENQARQIREMENAQRQAQPPAPKPKSELAPVLPAPVEIARPPGPRRPPAASVGSQN